MRTLGGAYVDLVHGGRCVGCEAPGVLLCPGCRASLPRHAGPCPPTPYLVPSGSGAGPAPVCVAGAYDGLLRALVLGHKERGLLGLGPTLGDLLALAVAEVAGTAGLAGGAAPLLLVPVPSRPSAVRARGHDPTHAMTVAAARALPGPVAVARLLRTRPGVLDQAGLDRTQRRANLAGSLGCRPSVLRRLARRGRAVHVVVCDDVVTTGSTVVEAQRALAAVGVRAAGVAAVAATPRRGPSGRA